MSNEIKIALSQLSKSVALPITSVLYVFYIISFFIFFFHPIPIFHTPYFLPTPHFLYSSFSTVRIFCPFINHLIVTWQWRTLLAINKLSCRQYFQAKRFVSFCTLSVAMNLPVSLPLLIVAGLFISSSKISGNFKCFQVFNKHHFATLKVCYSLLNKLLCLKKLFHFFELQEQRRPKT